MELFNRHRNSGIVRCIEKGRGAHVSSCIGFSMWCGVESYGTRGLCRALVPRLQITQKYIFVVDVVVVLLL